MAKAQGAGSIKNDPNRPLILVRTETNPNGVHRHTSTKPSGTDPDFSLTADLDAPAAETPAPFVWDKDYKNNEQVRPYFAGYTAVRDELESRGAYPYNDEFKGKIPGLEGPNEDTGIYMLQTMHSLDEMRGKVADFVEAGGVDSDTLEPGREYRGTVAAHGWYSGGTGWQTFESARFMYSEDRGFMFKEPKQKNWRKMFAKTMVIVDKPTSRKATSA